jgi:abortive infection bacteriophage resistance protein
LIFPYCVCIFDLTYSPPFPLDQGAQGGFFIYMHRIPYTKLPKTYAEQLQLLKDRGLKIESDSKAVHLLQKLSYYRLSGYWFPILEEPKCNHVFKSNASFQTAFKLYRFDRDLRIFILKELEKIEVAVRAQMIYTLSHYKGPFWFTDSELFSNTSSHTNSLNKLKHEFDKSDEEFIQSFKNKYLDNYPPSWMLLEIASFGGISALYKNIKPGRSKREIAHHFGLDDTTFASWLHCFVYIRNVCAHHSRLWNRGMSIRPKIPLNPIKTWLNDQTVSNNRTYFLLSMMLYLLQSVDQKHQFIFRFKILLKKYPNVDVTAMGFPKKWKDEPLWNFRPNIKQRTRMALTFKVS